MRSLHLGVLLISAVGCSDNDVPSGVLVRDGGLRDELEAVVMSVFSDAVETDGRDVYVDDIRLHSGGRATADVVIESRGGGTTCEVILGRVSGEWAVIEVANRMTFCAWPAPMQDAGARAFELRGCSQCHPPDADGDRGPTLRGMFGSERRLSDGTIVVVDEDYVRSTLFESGRATLEGWPPLMPIFGGGMRERHREKMVEVLTAYLKTLK